MLSHSQYRECCKLKKVLKNANEQSKVPLQNVEFSEIIHGKGKTTCIVNSKMNLYANMCYMDLDDCVSKISTFLKTPQGGNRFGVTVLPNINEWTRVLCRTINKEQIKNIYYEEQLQ